MMKIERNGNTFGTKIGDLVYGSIVTGVKGNPGCIYIKIRKSKCGVGVSVNHSKDHCVLVNLEYGGLREIPGNMCVTVLDGVLNVVEAKNINQYKKEYNRF